MLKFKEFLLENEKITEYDTEQKNKKTQDVSSNIKDVEIKIKTEEDELKKKTEVVNYVKSKFSNLLTKIKDVTDENEKSKIYKQSGVLDKQDIEKISNFYQYQKDIQQSQDYIKHLKNSLNKLKNSSTN
jgi:predicted nuclease with TOPRIM domain